MDITIDKLLQCHSLPIRKVFQQSTIMAQL
ncbi:Uncharacterised protein [Vibrio cholerae]|nr:Uncharacterised protein [Vibrio cholerae]